MVARSCGWTDITCNDGDDNPNDESSVFLGRTLYLDVSYISSEDEIGEAEGKRIAYCSL